MIVFQNFNEDSRIKAIRKAKKSILWVTPNILPSEADALVDMERVLGKGNVECIISENIEKHNFDENALDIKKYLSSIEKLKNLKCKVKVIKQLKLGLIICDNIIYNFDYSVVDEDKDISCTTVTINDVDLKKMCIEVKTDILSGKMVHELDEEFSGELKNKILEDKNNILAILRSYVQGVNITFCGVRIVDKTVNVSSFLKKYVFKDKEYRKDIKVAFKVFNDIQSIKNCSSEFNKFDLKIKKKNLIKIESLGFIIPKNKKKELKSSIDEFLKKQKNKIKKSKNLQSEIDNVRENLKNHLLSILKDYSINKNDDNIEAMNKELEKIPDSATIISRLSCKLNYYDISIDMINNKKFYKQLIAEIKNSKKFKNDEILELLLDES